MGTCLACGGFFPVREPEPRPEAAIFSPTLDPWVALIGCLVVGVLFLAFLAHLQILGGVLLILIGVGIVVTVGAYEAGYLERPAKALRAGLPELRRSLTKGQGSP